MLQNVSVGEKNGNIQPLNQNKMKQTAVQLLRKRLLKDKEIFPNDSEYINGILYDIDNELLAMEKEQIMDAWFDGVTNWDSEKEVEDYIKQTFKSE